MLKKTLFNKVIYKGITAAIIGIVAGLLLGLLIWGLEASVVFIKNLMVNKVDSYVYAFQEAQIEPLTILGMAFGALIGSVSGIWTAIVEEKRAPVTHRK